MAEKPTVNWLADTLQLVEMAQVVTASRAGDARPRRSPTGRDEPTIRLLNELLVRAVRLEVSDVHLVMAGVKLRVRFRVDGVLYDALEMPGELAPGLISRIKHLAGLRLSELRHPQQGSFVIEVDGSSVDIRVQTIALFAGESCVLRILDRARPLLGLDELGMPAATLASYREVAHTPGGMIVAVGPVGSGKTTTLHATLVEIADESLNVVTIEDPVEYVFPQFQQINVNDETGVSFLEGLRVTLRFDSNIILVGEIRDEETAQTALSAALTGHAVLTTTHARDATSAILRLSAMEIEAFLLANALKGVVAQRLVRRICDNCREPVELPLLERAFIEQFLPEKEGFTKGRGCEECKGTGYHGRLGVYEFLRMTPAIGKLISSSPNEDAIRATALAEGMITLEQGALALVHDDKTTPAEVLRGVFSK